MKVSNWRKKIGASLVAAGMLSPAAANAINIPLVDASFEDYVVPSTGLYAGYAYSDLYRPTSAWIDDQDHPLFAGDERVQDDGNGNWMFNAAYAESTNRAAPRTGNQALHGRFNYNSQETGAVFEVGRTYTFSIYAQGDSDTAFDFSSIYLYLFDASQPFDEATSTKFQKFSPMTGNFINRPEGALPTQSKALWQRVSISHTVQLNAPEAGKPIGVGVYGNPDAGMDDAALDVTSLTLEINTTNGHARIVNETGKQLNFDYYQITSANSSLNKAGWGSFQDLHPTGFPQGTGSGNGWEEFDVTSDAGIGESWLLGNSKLAPGESVGLGTAYALGDPRDLVFTYGKVTGASASADFNANGFVEGSDFLSWQRGNGAFGPAVTAASGNANTDLTVNGADFNIWRSEFGNSATPVGTGAATLGHVRYVPGGFAAIVPEPGSVILAGLGLAGLLMARRRS